MVLINLCAETIKPVFEGDNNMAAVAGNASVYEVYPVSRVAGEGRAGLTDVWPVRGGRG